MKNTKNQYENFSPLTIKSVDKESIAQELGLEPYDRILQINGQEILDELDYYYFTSLDYFTLEVLKKDGSIWEFEIEPGMDERMGLEFYTTLSSKTCDNNCIFCFIDQLPQGLRESLYVKDDDERLSFLNGNYVTLTNLSERELERIMNWKIPLNISVHTTDERLRTKMLANRKASQINEILKRLYGSGVPMNAQIVLVPEVNDVTLTETITDLYEYHPEMQTVSVVPIGLTKYREGLYPTRSFTREEARNIIGEVKRLQKRFMAESNTPFVFLSDEFYLLADVMIPEYTHYGAFTQIENGVGMTRYFYDSFKDALTSISGKVTNKRILLATGELFYPVLVEIVELFKKKYDEAQIDVAKVKNHFFGETVGVAGLLTGEDIIKQLKNKTDQYDLLLLPETLLKNDTSLLLDDTTIEELSRELKIEIKTIENASELLNTFIPN